MARFNNGWISIDRKLFESEIFQNDKLFKIWVWLLFRANWKPSRTLWEGNQRTLIRGQVLTGTTEISNEVNCARSTAQKWLKFLEKTGRISVETCPRGTLVTVLNYDEYQSPLEDGRPKDEQSSNTTRTQREHKPALNNKGNKGTKNISSEQSSKPIVALEELKPIHATIQERDISTNVQKSWLEAFPEPEWIIGEIRKALAWEASNPRRRKKQFSKFMTSWLTRSWDSRKIAYSKTNQESSRKEFSA